MKPMPLVAIGLCVFLVHRTLALAEDTAPRTIGDRTCLFLDDHFLAEHSGLTRTWHQGQPRTDVTIKDEGHPWERWPHMFGSTLFDPQAKRYRMYYESAISPS